jgi:hypothetical protein
MVIASKIPLLLVSCGLPVPTAVPAIASETLPSDRQRQALVQMVLASHVWDVVSAYIEIPVRCCP